MTRWDEIRTERNWANTRTKQLATQHIHYPRIDSDDTNDQGTTASTTFTDLTGAVVGPSATVDVGPQGKVLVLWRSQFANDTLGAFCLMGIDVSGANTAAASDPISLNSQQAADHDTGAGTHHLYTGLTPGPTTFTAKYRVTSGTGTWLRQEVTAWSMDSMSSL
jgi:hypothetical protein